MVIAVLFAGLGVFSLWNANAATSFKSAEAETGAIAQPATIVSDQAAAGGNAVKFGASTTPCNGPLTITTGGTYTGCYQSTDSNKAAITVATTQPVTINRATIKHAGVGIDHGASRANITVTNSVFTASAPSVADAEQQAVRFYQPATFVIEHNRFVDGHGVLVNGDNVATNTFRVSYNDYIDIGRYSQPAAYPGAVHTDKVIAPGGKILWNRISNHHGRSQAEDVFGLASTKGAAGNPIEVGHNLVNGAYPITRDGAGFTGGAFDFGDISGAYISGFNNYAVNYTNNGFMIPTGNEIYHRSSVAVYDGIADDGQRISSTFGNGFTTWNNDGYEPSGNIGVSDSKSGHRRWNGTAWERDDFYLPVGANSNNTSLGTVDAAAEQAAINEFEQSVVANGVTIGPQ